MKKHYTKGFTLVELAIVLIVIGLLLGMAFKARNMVDAARVKSDISKITKISTAFNTYFSKFDTLPGIKPDGSITSKSIY